MGFRLKCQTCATSATIIVAAMVTVMVCSTSKFWTRNYQVNMSKLKLIMSYFLAFAQVSILTKLSLTKDTQDPPNCWQVSFQFFVTFNLVVDPREIRSNALGHHLRMRS